MATAWVCLLLQRLWRLQVLMLPGRQFATRLCPLTRALPACFRLSMAKLRERQRCALLEILEQGYSRLTLCLLLYVAILAFLELARNRL